MLVLSVDVKEERIDNVSELEPRQVPQLYSQPSVIVPPSFHCPPFDPTPPIILTFSLFVYYYFA